ncbi:uncharacterized protein [Branchiostoma lanceolatum]|uniref:uncharacterized protein n=1 Tax=Branchiostoma lanceolatum TaxID=7740 RepID=UPI003455E655
MDLISTSIRMKPRKRPVNGPHLLTKSWTDRQRRQRSKAAPECKILQHKCCDDHLNGDLVHVEHMQPNNDDENLFGPTLRDESDDDEMFLPHSTQRYQCRAGRQIETFYWMSVRRAASLGESVTDVRASVTSGPIARGATQQASSTKRRERERTRSVAEPRCEANRLRCYNRCYSETKPEAS